LPRVLTAPAPIVEREWLLGQLYIVTVRLKRKDSGEIIKHKLLMVGCEHDDIERKLYWVFDAAQYSEFWIKDVEKVREKVHILSTVVNQPGEPTGPVIHVGERSQVVQQQPVLVEPYQPRRFAVGIVTTMIARDELHALRKVGNALIDKGSTTISHAGAALSEDSQVTIEEVPLSSGFARARSAEGEATRAHVIRN
jgi:hypothetical protein